MLSFELSFELSHALNQIFLTPSAVIRLFISSTFHFRRGNGVKQSACFLSGRRILPPAAAP